MCRGLLGAAPNPMRPVGSVGSPSVSFFHVLPPSLDRKMPPLVPPESSAHGYRRTRHRPAKSTMGLPGSMMSELAPVSSSTNKTFFHVVPPSVVRSEEYTSELQSHSF